MGELFVCPHKLKENAEEMAEMSNFINERNQALKNIGENLKKQSGYGNIAKVIFSLGNELEDVSEKMDKLGEVLGLSAWEYEKTEKKIIRRGRAIPKREIKTDSEDNSSENSDNEKTLGKEKQRGDEKNGTDHSSTSETGEETSATSENSTVLPATSGNGNPVGEKQNGWLQLYDGATVDQEGRQVTMPTGNNPNKWAMREGLDTINKYARMAVEGTNTVIQGPNGELVDSEGRYWVAVGPNVMNPNHEGGQACSAAEMKYGTKIDVVVTDGNGNRYYIPCVVGDCKAHTYPNGIYQTGDAFPNGTDSHPQNNDGSVVEFCGKGSIKGLGEYAIESIVVYD